MIISDVCVTNYMFTDFLFNELLFEIRKHDSNGQGLFKSSLGSSSMQVTRLKH